MNSRAAMCPWDACSQNALPAPCRPVSGQRAASRYTRHTGLEILHTGQMNLRPCSRAFPSWDLPWCDDAMRFCAAACACALACPRTIVSLGSRPPLRRSASGRAPRQARDRARKDQHTAEPGTLPSRSWPLRDVQPTRPGVFGSATCDFYGGVRQEHVGWSTAEWRIL